MNKTIIFDHDAHIRLWDWLSKNPSKDKSDWKEWEDNGGDLRSMQADCFACEAANNYKKAAHPQDYSSLFHPCDCCPFGNFENYCLGGLFVDWAMSYNPAKRKLLAETIRDLPITNGWEPILIKDKKCHKTKK